VLKSSPNQELAMAFINFLNEPDNATRLAEYVFYATPNKEAEKRLPVEFRNNPTIYPPKDVVAKSEFYANLPPAVVAARNRLYFRAISRKFSR
jgi:spermidine/putrescine transport system substrate-binding protein